MAIRDALLHELQTECAKTRALLERVPEDKLNWRPHEKSMPMGRLATHLAELTGWGKLVLGQDEIDIGAGFTPTIQESVAEILATHDKNVAACKEILAETPDEEFSKTWTMKHQGKAVFSAPKFGVMRDFVLNHMVHHRGQLTVFLRLNDVSLPMTYGPSADEAGGLG